MTADLALLASDPTSLDVYDDPGKQIVLACERANAWLKAGIEVRIETIVETKAQAAALAAFAIQKQLGHDAELAALEVQRRAERGVGLAIRRGQERGEIRTAADTHTPGRSNRVGDGTSVSPAEAAGTNDRSELVPIYRMTDDVTDDQFEDAIEGAKAEGNLSRANVVRKVRGEKSERLTTPQKIDRIRDLAGKGWSSQQIARDLGHTEDWIRGLARANGVEISADKVIGKARRIDSNHVMAEIVATLDGLALPMRLINLNDLDAAQAGEWANSLTESIRALNRFAKQIKELAQ